MNPLNIKAIVPCNKKMINERTKNFPKSTGAHSCEIFDVSNIIIINPYYKTLLETPI